MSCVITFRVIGPCSKCGKQIDGNPDNQAHLTDDGGVRCERCCAWCKTQDIDWSTRKPEATTEGKQEGLWSVSLEDKND